MSWIHRLSNVLRRRDLNAEIDDELQFHIESRIRENVEAGMAEDEARRDALERFGSRSRIREETRDADVIVLVESAVQDVNFAMRSLRKQPGFVAVALMTLAIGIGANSAIFTVVRSVLQRPLPYADSQNLYAISYGHTGGGPFARYPGLSDSHYLLFREHDRSFERTASFATTPITLTGVADPVRVASATVTPEFFRVLGINPAAGRGFAADDDHEGRDRVALISDGLWRSRFGSDPTVLNRTITLDGIPHTLIGILPAGFAYPPTAEIWTPLAIRTDPHRSYMRPVIGRLKAGITHEQAQTMFDAFAGTLPEDARDRRGVVPLIVPLKEAIVGDVRRPLTIFMGAVAFVLLIACVNVAHLFLMRAVGRRQEIATRLALGASRVRVIRQLITESLLVALAGGATALGAARLGQAALLAAIPVGLLPRQSEIHLDGGVFAFTLTVAVIAGLLLGLVPALLATRHDLSGTLREGTASATRQSHRVRQMLIVAEIALALVLLVGAGLLLKSFLSLRAVDPGFKPDHVITMTVDMPESKHRTAEEMSAFHERVLTSISTLPDAVAVGAVNWLPLGDVFVQGTFRLVAGQSPGFMLMKACVTPGYLRAMGIQLLRGRDFDTGDRARTAGVAIVSASAARRLWPNEDAVGKRISLEDDPRPEDWLTIVGVVDDVRQGGLKGEPVLAVYQPYQQVTNTFFLSRMTFVVRTSGDPEKLGPMMRTALTSLDNTQAAQSILTMEDVIAGTIAEPRFQTRLLGVFSIIALILAAIGVYGVLASTVAERRREIGIRMALGADRSAVVRFVIGRTMVLSAIGVILGIIGALALTRLLATLLFRVTPTDVTIFTMAACVLALVAFVSSLVPARQASAVDPLIALRVD